MSDIKSDPLYQATARAVAKARETRLAEALADNARLQELLRGTGANRYWEGRWRDADRINAMLVDTVRNCSCPRPANRAPDDLTVAHCMARLECGCVLGAALRAATEAKRT